MPKQISSISIAIILFTIIIPLLGLCFHSSGAVVIENIDINETPVSTFSVNKPILSAGDFQYFDVHLSTDVDKISIVAYYGNSEPDIEKRSEKNYYCWEFLNGFWQDNSGHDKKYIKSDKCKINDKIYSFLISLDARAKQGDWTIKVFIDSEDAPSLSMDIFCIRSNILFFALTGVVSNSDIDKLLKLKRINNRNDLLHKSTTDRVDLKKIEDFVDSSLTDHNQFSNIEVKEACDEKIELKYECCVDSNKQNDENIVKQKFYSNSKNNCFQSSDNSPLQLSLKKGIIPPPIKNIFNPLKVRGLIPFFVLFLLLFNVFIPLISSEDFQIEGNQDVNLIFTFYPNQVMNGDELLINASISNMYNITKIFVELNTECIIDLSHVNYCNNVSYWQGNWIVCNMDSGEYCVTLTAVGHNDVRFRTDSILLVSSFNNSDDPVYNQEVISQDENSSSGTSSNSVVDNSSNLNYSDNDFKISQDVISNLRENSDYNIFGEVISTDMSDTIYSSGDAGVELFERRTVFSKTFVLNDSEYQKRIGIAPIHYYDAQGKLQNINTSIVQSSESEDFFEVTKGFYSTKFKKVLSSDSIVQYQFRDYDIMIALQNVKWSTNKGMNEVITQVQSVESFVRGNKILYPNAFGEGVHVEFVYHPQYFGKYLVIDDYACLSRSNTAVEYQYLEFNYKIEYSETLEVFINSEKWDGSHIVTDGKVEFRDKISGETQFYFNNPLAEDSAGQTIPIEFVLEQNNSEILISKRIDKQWLENAVYPVRADAVETIYLEGDAYDMYDEDGTNVDDSTIVQIGRSGGSNWDGYWVFPISSDIIDGTINTVNFTGYITQNDIDVNPVLYGLQQEDCPALEGAEDPSGYTRTTNSYTWSALNGGGTGSATTGDISSVFNEWITDYTHASPPDRFGIVLDDSGAGNNKEVFFYDYSHTSYSSNTYLTIDYTPAPDNDPPTPDPLTWNTEPYETTSSSITMIATTASDATPPIQYFFNETTGNSGGSDSTWQSSTTFTDDGLSENTQYGYEVKARDSNTTPNEGNYSTPISYEYTDVDPPTDNELTFTYDVAWMNATVAAPPNPTSGSTGSYFNWLTGGATNSDWQTGVYYHNRTGLTENTEYGSQVRYRNADADASNYNPTEKTNYTLCNPPTDGEFTIDGFGVNWINMSVAHPTNPTSGLTAAYFECVTGGALESGWVTTSSGGRFYYNATGLSGSTTYGFRVKYRNGDGIPTTSTNEKQQTTNAGSTPPTVVTFSATGVEETNATLQGLLSTNGSSDTTCYFLWDTTNPPTANNVSQGIIANGASFSYDTSGTGTLSKGTLYYVDTKANNSVGWDNSGGIEVFLTKPDPPNTLAAQMNSSNEIYLTWVKGDGANNTYIERNTIANWGRGTGTEIYNDTGTQFEDTTVTQGITYYYQSWSFTNWTYLITLHQWSDNNNSASNTTNNPPVITDEIPSNESTEISLIPNMNITVSDTEGASMTITWYSNTSGSWVAFGTNITGVDGNGTYHQTNNNFSNYSTTYYWYITVNDGVETNTSNIFHFTTVVINTSVNAISPYSIRYSPLTITANGDTDLDNVTLFYRWSDDNQSWAPWVTLSYDDFENGFGNYTDGGEDCELYTGGTYAHQGNNAANIQDDLGDASSFYHTSGIDVDTPGYTIIKVDFWFYAVGMVDGQDLHVEYYNGTTWEEIKNYTAGTDFENNQFYHEIVWINETGGQSHIFPTNMQIKFRCHAANNNNDIYIDEIYVTATTASTGGNGINWTKWDSPINPDIENPWSWNFDFPNSTGYYEFYSIGQKSGSQTEPAPSDADAICYHINPITPVINSYDLFNSTGSKINNASIDVNSEYIFQINVTDENGWEDIEYINITAWYDNESDATVYNQTGNIGGNLNMFLQYENTTGTANFTMLWPDDEADLILINCTETIINSTTRIINLSFKPKSQIRYANTTGGWDTNPGWNDLNSWNFEINVTDYADKYSVAQDEYGVYRHTNIETSQDWVGVFAYPGGNDTSSIVTLTYSSNYDYNISLWFEQNLTNQTWSMEIPIANNVDILENTDPNDDINSGDITFNGIGESNAVLIISTSGLFQNNGITQTVDVQFNVRIPFGTMWGEYIARIAVKIIQ